MKIKKEIKGGCFHYQPLFSPFSPLTSTLSFFSFILLYPLYPLLTSLSSFNLLAKKKPPEESEGDIWQASVLYLINS